MTKDEFIKHYISNYPDKEKKIRDNILIPRRCAGGMHENIEYSCKGWIMVPKDDLDWYIEVGYAK